LERRVARAAARQASVDVPADVGGRLLARALGAVFLAGALTASAMLTAQHFGAHLPGCGPAAGCAAVQNSAYSRVLGWPVAFGGTAYFGAMLAAFLVTWRTGLPRALRWVSWAAVLGSAWFVGVMLHLGEFCRYCALAHAGNLAWVASGVAGAWGRRDGGASMRVRSLASRGMGTAAFVGVFLLTSAALGVAGARHADRVARAAEEERAKSAAAIIERSNAAIPQQPVDRWGAGGFTGRYRSGPEQAAIRIVVLTDYQCPDCKRVEGEIEEVLAARPDASLSVKHFPMCLDCNKHAGRTLHPNACFAARAAEAAGILGGDEAFFKMHRWLFEQGGRFESVEQLKAGADAAGLDVNTLAPLMQSPATLKSVQGDVEDGIALGIYSTPMVFVNGVEFKGWQVAGAFKKTIEQVAATNPAPRTAADDRPVLALQRYMNDWKEGRVLPKQGDTTRWTTGLAPDAAAPEGAKVVEVVVWGDYQEENTVRLDAQLREAMKGRTSVRYTFRHYPVDAACNTALPAGVPAAALHPLACKAARAAEAGGQLGGNEGYWKMHAWLMANMKALSDATLRAAAESFGWDAQAFERAMNSEKTTAAITEDCEAAKRLGLTSIPFVVVNDKQVPRTWREGSNVMSLVLDEAAK
jgi:predicted DsbA family dithiol-disulfide isomerase/uncharacterized membrane protein